jgi:hypothetical protein
MSGARDALLIAGGAQGGSAPTPASETFEQIEQDAAGEDVSWND